MTSHRSKKIRRGGFTLIELLVVIGIIAVLIGLLLPVMSKVRQRAYAASTSAQLSTIASAIQQYQADFASVPGPLLNAQLGYLYYGNPGVPSPVVVNPVAPNNPARLQLKPTTGAGLQTFSRINNITGAENLLLGLCGGLEINVNPGNGAVTFDYCPSLLFSNDVVNREIPAPKGALSLYSPKPKRFPAYLDVKSGQISKPDLASNNGQFTDDAGRVADDSPIPEFVDQYPEGLPIIYIRANVGATAICGLGGKASLNGAQLIDPTSGQPVTPQYDLSGVVAYTRDTASPPPNPPSGIGTKSSYANAAHHGLQDVGAFTGNVISDTSTRTTPVDQNNGVAYFKDPNNPGTSNEVGNARQKNGYILISPGPDRIYGTTDDIIYPGSLQP